MIISYPIDNTDNEDKGVEGGKGGEMEKGYLNKIFLYKLL